MITEELAAIEARALAVADAFDDDVPLKLDTYVWKYAPGQQKRFTSIHGEQGDIAAIEGWDDDATATVEALIGAVNVARVDIPALLAVLRERDNTIAALEAAAANVVDMTIHPEGANGAAPGFTTVTIEGRNDIITYTNFPAALDPQETP